MAAILLVDMVDMRIAQTPLFLNSVLIEPPSMMIRIASDSIGATEST